jgi:SPP1 gp7 family putative phage head morphogenesis protein
LYTKRILVLQDAWEALVWSELGIKRTDSMRSDSLKSVLNASFLRLLRNSGLDSLLENIGEKIAGKATKYMKSVVRIPATIKGKETAIDEFRRRNIELITKLGDSQAEALDTLFRAGAKSGARHEDLAKEVAKVLGAGGSRAELIARDQVLKFNSSMNQLAQTGAGVRSYIWTTAGDERVRESHQDLDGTEHDWDNPPIVDGEPAHPGEPVQCRCQPTPVIPLLADI